MTKPYHISNYHDYKYLIRYWYDGMNDLDKQYFKATIKSITGIADKTFYIYLSLRKDNPNDIPALYLQTAAILLGLEVQELINYPIPAKVMPSFDASHQDRVRRKFNLIKKTA